MPKTMLEYIQGADKVLALEDLKLGRKKQIHN